MFLSYIDRSNLAVAASDLSYELGLDPRQLGRLSSAFFWSYAVSLWFAGWFMARFEVHRLFAFAFLAWTLATAFTGMAHGFVIIFALRLVLGMGESLAYPSCNQIIARDFPEHKRGFANSVIDACTKLGPAVGTLTGGLIVAHWGWRALFFLLGFGGLLWLPFWFGARPKSPDPQTPHASEAPVAAPSMLEILRVRSAWGSFLGLFCLNYIWYFLLTWLPYYLVRERHFSTQRMALLGSLPYLAIAASSMASGRISDRWIERGGSPTRVRKTFMVAGLLLATLIVPAAAVDNDDIFMGVLIFACVAFGLATSNLWTITQTCAGPPAAAKWTGMQNSLGNLAGITAPWLTGEVVSATGSFYLAFVAAGLISALGAVSFGLIVGKVETVKWAKATPP